MTVLDRYIVRNFLYAFVLSTGVMLVVIIGLDLMVKNDEFLEGNPPPAVVVNNIWNYYSTHFFLFFSFLCGPMTLIAAVVTVARLVRFNELTALLASGIPLRRVLIPIVLCSVGTMALWLANSELAIPRVADQLVRRHDEIGGGVRQIKVPFARLELPPESNARVADETDHLFSARFYPYTTPPKIFDVTVVARAGEEAAWTMWADRGWWDDEAGVWRLQRGIRLRPPPPPDDVATPTTGPIDASADGEQRFRRDPVDRYAGFAPQDLLLRQQLRWMNFLALRDLREMTQRRDLSEVQRETTLKYQHTRITTPMVAVLVAMIGACFFLRRGPVNLLAQSTKCLAVCGALLGLSAGLGQARLLSPEMAAWLPVFLAMPIAGFMLGRLRT